MALVGYAHVSTRDRHPQAHTDALTAAGCDKASPTTPPGLGKRPALEQALDYLRPGDTLVITKLDRLGRSVRNLKALADDLQTCQVGLRALSQGIDTTGPRRPAVLPHARRHRRVRARPDRRAHPRRPGRCLGPRPLRRPQVQDDPNRVRQARAMYNAGQHTVQEIADTFGVSRPTIYRHLAGTATPPAPAPAGPAAPNTGSGCPETSETPRQRELTTPLGQAEPVTLTQEPVAIQVVSPAATAATEALWAYTDDVASRYYGRRATSKEIAAALSEDPSDDLAPPHGLFLVARREAAIVGCAGLRLLPSALGEVKRVFVVPAERGRGLGRSLMARVEELARQHGVGTLRLDTRGDLVEARALYASLGYQEVPAFNGGPYSEHWFAKTLP